MTQTPQVGEERNPFVDALRSEMSQLARSSATRFPRQEERAVIGEIREHPEHGLVRLTSITMQGARWETIPPAPCRAGNKVMHLWLSWPLVQPKPQGDSA